MAFRYVAYLAVWAWARERLLGRQAGPEVWLAEDFDENFQKAVTR